MNYYVVVHQTKHPDYTVISGHVVEADNQHSAEQAARRMFSEDTGYEFVNTKISYIKPGTETGKDEVYNDK